MLPPKSCGLQLTKPGIPVSCNGSNAALLRDPNSVNAYFVKVAFKDMYNSTELDCFHRECNSNDYQPLECHFWVY